MTTPTTKFQVGDVFRLVVVSVMGNDPGARAVCYEVYELASDNASEREQYGPMRPGWSLIFPNGLYSGFCPDEMKWLEFERHEPSIADYQFSNVMHLARDFRDGRFKAALEEAP